jgi:DNA-directed RNA polymerase specialized sigma24 family protein
MSIVPDTELVARLRAGDAAGLDGLLERHEDHVLAACFAVLRDPALALDLCAETFARLVLELRTERVPPPASVGPWLLELAGDVLQDSAAAGALVTLARDRLRAPAVTVTAGDLARVAELGDPEVARRERARLPLELASARERLVRSAPPPHALRGLRRSRLVLEVAAPDREEPAP